MSHSIKLIAAQIRDIDNSFWQLCAAAEACIDLYEATGDRVYLTQCGTIFEYLWSGRASHGLCYEEYKFANPYNDDLMWWCLAALRYRRYLTDDIITAKKIERGLRWIFDTVTRRGFRTVKNGVGILWNGDEGSQSADMCCCSMFSYAIVAAALGEIQRANNVYDYAVKALLRPDGFLCDKIDRTDRVEDEATYNYGLLLLAARALGRPRPPIRLPSTELYLRKEQHEYNLEFAPIILIRGLRAGGLDVAAAVAAWTSLPITRDTVYTRLLSHYGEKIRQQEITNAIHSTTAGIDQLGQIRGRGGAALAANRRGDLRDGSIIPAL